MIEVNGCCHGGLLPSLTEAHNQHFLDDGWTDSEIAQAVDLGVRSVDQIEASRLLGYPAPAEQLHQFLASLGYGPGDKVYVKGIAPKKTPEEVLLSQGLAFIRQGEARVIPSTKQGFLSLGDGTATLTAQTKKRDTLHRDARHTLRQWNEPGRGIYLVVNPGGAKNTDISEARALFWECDGITKDEQWAKVQDIEARLGVALTVVETFKSLHCYILLDAPVTDMAEWVRLQQRLIQRQDSDGSIHNAARLMRLPGLDHWRWDEESQQLKSFPVTLRQLGSTVALEAVEALLPEWDRARWGKAEKAQQRARVRDGGGVHYSPMDADSPWDIRNFAHTLEGYNPGGRPGWITAQCPAHNGQSLDSLHINETDGAYICHGGCDSRSVYRAARRVAEGAGYRFPAFTPAMGTTADQAPAIIHDDTEQVELAQDSERIQQRLLDTLQRQLAKLRVHDRVAASYRLAPERPTHPDEGGDVQQFNTQEDAYRTALDEGARLIVNLTGTGGNKTGFVARSFPHNWGVERIIAITPDVLNAESFNPEFAKWEILSGRNYGEILDEDGKRRRANIDTPDHLKVEPGNCSRAYVPQILASKNAANPNLACLTCVYGNSQLCSEGTEPNKFGAKNQQHAAWESKRILASYGRLTGIGLGDEAENLAKAGLFLDESSGNVETTKALDIDDKALDQTIAAIAMEAPDLLAPLNPLLGWLREKQYQNHPRYDKRYGMPLARCLDEVRGLIPDNLNWEALNQLEDGHHERVLFGLDKVKLTDQEKRRLANLSKKREATKAKLKRIAELEAKAAAADGHIFRNAKGIKGTRKALGFDGLTPDERRELRDLKRSILTDTEAAELADLQARYEASKTEALDPGQAAAAAKAVRLRWLCDFIAIVLGDAPGNIRFMPDGIVATIQQTAHLDAIHSAKFTVLTDASERRTKAALAQKYGFAEHEIFIFEISQPKHQNSQLVQVTGLGAMGRNRGLGLEECKNALVAKLKELDPTHVHFDHKGYSHDARLFVDSIGSNDFKDCTSISATPPRPSINGLLDEYCVLNKTIVDDDDAGFQAFYAERYAELIRQWQGRTRANLKPGVAHTHYILTDEVLPITPDRIIPAWEICPEAARKGRRAVLALIDVAQNILATGAKLTQVALSAASAAAGLNQGKGYCQSHICSLWVDIKNGLSLFLRGSYKKSDISPDRLKALQDKAALLGMAFGDEVVTPDGGAVPMAGALSWGERAAELVAMLADLMDGPPEDDLPWLLELLPEGQNGSILGLLAAIFIPDWAPIGGGHHA